MRLRHSVPHVRYFTTQHGIKCMGCARHERSLAVLPAVSGMLWLHMAQLTP